MQESRAVRKVQNRDIYFSQGLVFSNILRTHALARFSLDDFDVQSIDFCDGQQSSTARISLKRELEACQKLRKQKRHLVRKDLAKRHVGRRKSGGRMLGDETVSQGEETKGKKIFSCSISP
jgi:hypothetical protein